MEDAEESSWYFNPSNQTTPSNPPPTNNRFSLTPGFGRGGYNAWSTGVGEIEFFNDPTNPQAGTTPVWPAFYEYPTILGTKEMYDQQGRWSWPAEVFLDITNSMGVPDGMIQVPVISRWNKGLIEDEYPGLIPTSEWNDHFPQYKNPYSYTEGTDHWATGTGVGPNLSGQWGTIDWMYAGGWDTEVAGNVSKEWDYWYTGQKDTAFRRYQRVEFKVLLTTEISNQIHSYLQDNPGSTIKFRTAWWSDKEQNGSDAVGQFLDPDGSGAPQGVSIDYSDAAWNRQPHGMGYNSDGGTSGGTPPGSSFINITSPGFTYGSFTNQIGQIDDSGGPGTGTGITVTVETEQPPTLGMSYGAINTTDIDTGDSRILVDPNSIITGYTQAGTGRAGEVAKIITTFDIYSDYYICAPGRNGFAPVYSQVECTLVVTHPYYSNNTNGILTDTVNYVFKTCIED